jgi:hypothetical protein
MIRFLERDNAPNFIKLAGTGERGEWGMPIYFASSGDPVYEVQQDKYPLPEALTAIHIPRGAAADPTSDGELTIYDLQAGVVCGLWHAQYEEPTDKWSADGGDCYYLASNGLNGDLRQADDHRNSGHRGVPSAIAAVRFDEVQVGVIDHVLKLAVDNAHWRHVFPMIGSDGDSDARFAPPEGARIRLRPGVRLKGLGLVPAALTVARALKRYGAVIGDQSGGGVTLKVENTVAEGRGWLWRDLLNAKSLSKIPLSRYVIVQLGYGR